MKCLPLDNKRISSYKTFNSANECPLSRRPAETTLSLSRFSRTNTLSINHFPLAGFHSVVVKLCFAFKTIEERSLLLFLSEGKTNCCKSQGISSFSV